MIQSQKKKQKVVHQAIKITKMNQNESSSQENENANELEEKYVSIPLNLSMILNENRGENWTLNNGQSNELLPKWESDLKCRIMDVTVDSDEC